MNLSKVTTRSAAVKALCRAYEAKEKAHKALVADVERIHGREIAWHTPIPKLPALASDAAAEALHNAEHDVSEVESWCVAARLGAYDSADGHRFKLYGPRGRPASWQTTHSLWWELVDYPRRQKASAA